MNTLLPVIVLGMLALVATLKWRHAVVLALMLLVFEGAIRKWMLPEYQVWIYFAKDCLLLGAYIGYARAQLKRGQPLIDLHHPVNKTLILAALFCVVELANPASNNWLLATFGLRAYLLYVPLIYIVPHVFQSHAALSKAVGLAVVVSLVPLLIGPIQFSSPPDSIWNRYAFQEGANMFIAQTPGGRARITGTFPYITGYATFLQLLVTAALIGVLWATSWRTRAIAGILLVLGLGNLFMTGSRGPVLLVAVSGLLLLFYMVQSGRMLRIRSILSIFMVLPILWIVATSAFSDALESFGVRAQENDSEGVGRILGVITGPVWALSEAGIIGFGIGSTHQITTMVLTDSTTAVALPPPAEMEWDRIILELGPFGFILVMAVRFIVVLHLWRTLWASRGHSLEPFRLAAFLFTVVSLPMPMIFNATAGMLFWLLAGLASVPLGEKDPLDERATKQTVLRRPPLGSASNAAIRIPMSDPVSDAI